MRVGAVASLGILLLSPLTTLAAEFRVGDQPSFPAGETLVNDLYMAGGSVTAGGTVRGDLVVTGGNILSTSIVQSDVAAFGGSVSILGDVGDDVRAAGGEIVIQGKVGNDVLVAGGQVNISGKGIGGDVTTAGGVVRIEAPVSGKLWIAAGNVYINAPISGDTEIKADKIQLGPKAVLAGKFTYTSPEMATLEEGAVVKGETTFTQSADVKNAAKAGAGALVSLWFIAKFFMLLLGALAIAFFFRKYAEKLVRVATDETMLEIGRGLVFFIVVPVVSVILLFTIIGIPFGLLGLIIFAGAMVFASLAAPILVGSLAHGWIFRPIEYRIDWKTILLGAIIYSILSLIPIIGWIAKFVVLLLTIGTMFNIKWNILKEWR